MLGSNLAIRSKQGRGGESDFNWEMESDFNWEMEVVIFCHIFFWACPVIAYSLPGNNTTNDASNKDSSLAVNSQLLRHAWNKYANSTPGKNAERAAVPKDQAQADSHACQWTAKDIHKEVELFGKPLSCRLWVVWCALDGSWKLPMSTP